MNVWFVGCVFLDALLVVTSPVSKLKPTKIRFSRTVSS